MGKKLSRRTRVEEISSNITLQDYSMIKILLPTAGSTLI